MKRTIDQSLSWVGKAAMAGAALLGASYVADLVVRSAIASSVQSFTNRLIKDPYQENLWELVHATSRISPQIVVETGLRTQSGKVITRPLGSMRQFPELHSIFFDFAQVARSARPADLPVDTSVVIGPQAGRPMKIEIPIMIAGMAWSLALSGAAKISLAKGARLAGTCANCGEGVPAPGEIKAAGKFVLQIGRSCWNRQEHLIKQADMIEIQIGQGATGSSGHPVEYKDLEPGTQAIYGLHSKKEAIHLYTGLPELHSSNEVGQLVKALRNMTDVPIGVKIGASKFLEEDLSILIEAGCDAIWLDGSQAGSHAAAPILMDDFGLPTFYAVCRAADYLKQQGLKGKVSLIASGGLFTPGDFLKCMALGADAVGIGTMALLAISHKDIVKVLPWEPPTQLVFAKGNRLKSFNIEAGAKGLYQYLMSCTEEMALAAHAMGRESLQAIERCDLMTTDRSVAEVAGIAFTGDPQPLGTAAALQPEWLRREHALAHVAEIDKAQSHSTCGRLF